MNPNFAYPCLPYEGRGTKRKCCCKKTVEDKKFFFTADPALCVKGFSDEFLVSAAPQAREPFDVPVLELDFRQFQAAPNSSSSITFTGVDIPDDAAVLWSIFVAGKGGDLINPNPITEADVNEITYQFPSRDTLLDLQDDSPVKTTFFELLVTLTVTEQPEVNGDPAIVTTQVWDTVFTYNNDGRPTTWLLDDGITVEGEAIGAGNAYFPNIQDAIDNEIGLRSGQDKISIRGNENYANEVVVAFAKAIQDPNVATSFIPDLTEANMLINDPFPLNVNEVYDTDPITPPPGFDYVYIEMTAQIGEETLECEQKTYILYGFPQQVQPRIYTQNPEAGAPFKTRLVGESLLAGTGPEIVYETSNLVDVTNDPTAEFAYEGLFPEAFSQWSVKDNCTINVQDISEIGYAFQTIRWTCIPWTGNDANFQQTFDFIDVQRKIWEDPLNQRGSSNTPSIVTDRYGYARWSFFLPSEGDYNYTVQAEYLDANGDVQDTVYMRYIHRYQDRTVRTAERDILPDIHTANVLVTDQNITTYENTSVNENRIVPVSAGDPQLLIDFEYEGYTGQDGFQFANPVVEAGYEWVFVENTATLVITDPYKFVDQGRSDFTQATIQYQFYDITMNALAFKTLVVNVQYENGSPGVERQVTPATMVKYTNGGRATVSQNRALPEEKTFSRTADDPSNFTIPIFWGSYPVGTVTSIEATVQIQAGQTLTALSTGFANQTTTNNTAAAVATTFAWPVERTNLNDVQNFPVTITGDGPLIVFLTFTTEWPEGITYKNLKPSDLNPRHPDPTGDPIVFGEIQSYIDTVDYRNGTNDSRSNTEWSIPLSAIWQTRIAQYEAAGLSNGEISQLLPHYTISCNGLFNYFEKFDGATNPNGIAEADAVVYNTGTYSNGTEMKNYSFQPGIYSGSGTAGTAFIRFYTKKNSGGNTANNYNIIQIQIMD